MANDVKARFAGGDPKLFACFDKAGGINTKNTRQYIKDEQFSWLENIQPVGDGNFRALYAENTVFTPGGGKTIIYMYFFNIVSAGVNSIYAAIFYSNGTADSRNITAATTTAISGTPGTFYSGSGSLPACVQVGNSGIIIVATAGVNNLWTWDGTTLVAPGGAAPAWAGGGTISTGIAGTSVETYQGRLWVTNGSTVSFSAPGTLTVFSGATGGGTFTSTDSFLKRAFIAVRQVNGFLYIFADSSIQVISNVQTGGSPVTTTFNNQNVDPQSGTPWPNSVQTWGTNLIYANGVGVYLLSGGVTRKISDDLDGIFAASLVQLASFAPTSAVALLNGVKVYMLLMPVTGPYDSGSFRRAVIMWDGKNWFLGSQIVSMSFIGTQETDSELQAGMTEGTNLYQMFSTASASINKIYQTKLWSGDGVEITKQVLRVYNVFQPITGSVSIAATLENIQENTAIVSNTITITPSASVIVSGTGSLNMNTRANYFGITGKLTTSDFIALHQSVLYRNESPLGA